MQAIGNDIIDLHHASIMEHRDEGWMKRHLTSDEWRFLADYSNHDRTLTFWKIFALKEASSKAITQLGYQVPYGSFTHFETNLNQNSVVHSSGETLHIQIVEANQDWIHAVVTSSRESKIIWEVHRINSGSDASEYLQEKLLKSLKANGIQQAAFAQKSGIPFAIQVGRSMSPVSFSHSGRFAAFSWQLHTL
jgi:phosphopantetheine--protein transferase-like protein